MRLSTRTRYGLRFMYHLALRYNHGPVQLSDVAARERISEKYLGQIVIPLKSSKLIRSIRGAQGGYSLSRPPSKISLFQIVDSLEGDLSLVGCTEDPGTCEQSGECAATEVWKILRESMHQTLKTLSLEDMLHLKEKKLTTKK